MSGLIIIGLGWLIYQCIKDACIKDVTKDGNYDIDAAFRDSCKIGKPGGISKKEFIRRENNGYYNKKNMQWFIMKNFDDGYDEDYGEDW